MSTGDESFLARWSLRKHAARQAEEPTEAPADNEPPGEAEPSGHAVEPSVPLGDAETARPALPDLETLDGSSDYRGFLDRTVPKELRVAALRKAWASDPAIAGYRPLADYDWDFNAPGYAALRPTDDPAKFVTALFAHLTKPKPETASAAAAMPGIPDVPEESPTDAAVVEAPEESQDADVGSGLRREIPDAPTRA
jgi:hypothetical protein